MTTKDILSIGQCKTSFGHMCGQYYSSLGHILVTDGHTHEHTHTHTNTQSVLLYGVETWTFTKRMQQALESFHARVARHIARRPIRRRLLEDGSESWVYPSTSEVLEIAGLRPIMDYVASRRRYLLAYATQSSQMFPLAQTMPGTTDGWCQQPFVQEYWAGQQTNLDS